MTCGFALGVEARVIDCDMGSAAVPGVTFPAERPALAWRYWKHDI